MKATIRIQFVPRERDEELLEWIYLRVAGWRWIDIARIAGKRGGHIQMACEGVRRADREEGGEDVEGAYW